MISSKNKVQCRLMVGGEVHDISEAFNRGSLLLTQGQMARGKEDEEE